MYLISIFLIYISLFFVYPSFILDIVASVLTIPIYYLKLYRFNDINGNIKSVFPEKSDEEVLSINYNSTKITILNFLIGFFGRILYKYTLYANSIEVNIPDNIMTDLENEGIILVGSHYGTFYNAVIYLGTLLNKNIHMVHKSQKFIDNILYPKKFYKKMNFIQLKSGKTFSILEELDKGCIGLACDQRPSQNSKAKEKVIFLNNEVEFHLGPAILLKKTNRKLWCFNALYENYKTIITFTRLEDKVIDRNNLKDVTQIIANRLTEEIIYSPDQYLWFHRRFK